MIIKCVLVSEGIVAFFLNFSVSFLRKIGNGNKKIPY